MSLGSKLSVLNYLARMMGSRAHAIPHPRYERENVRKIPTERIRKIPTEKVRKVPAGK